MMEINIENRQSQVEMTDELISVLESTVMKVLEIEEIDRAGEVDISLVDETTIRDLNREHRGKDEVTDVLSFPQYEDLESLRRESGYLVMGDVVLCTTRAMEQAERFGHSLEREMAYLVVHSLYHLMGYDHLTPEEKAPMREKEEAALAAMGIGR